MTLLTKAIGGSSAVTMFNSGLISGALLVVCLCIVTAQNTCPAGTPGMPGIPGLPGRDGRDGEKGVKGVSGQTLYLEQEGIKGEKGDRGLHGPQGKRGKPGIQGLPGPAGDRGPQGDMGDTKPQSAFSVSRETTSHPAPNVPIIFNNVITNINSHFNAKDGKFECNFPGTYYFVYHATSRGMTLCIRLMVNGEKKATFCDHIQSTGAHYQMSSGGLAVYLKENDKVWLETSDNLNGMYAAGDRGNSVFSGFLLYTH